MELYNFISAFRTPADSINSIYSVSVHDSKFIYDVKGSDSVLYHFRFKSIEVNKVNNKYIIQAMDAVILTKHF
jgi:hypothetical protein